MATTKKAENSAAAAAAGVERAGYSKLEFAARWNLSEGLFNKLHADGKIKLTQIFDTDRYIITAEDDAEFGRQLKAYHEQKKMEAAAHKPQEKVAGKPSKKIPLTAST